MTDVVLDCDPGHDDAIALVLAAANSDVTLRAVTTVAGNSTLSHTTHNALKMCDLLDLNVPVISGADEPLERELETAAHVHGESGLAGPDLPEPTTDATPDEAVDRIAEEARTGENVILVATGPLTNVARALDRHPDLANELEDLIIMGGGTNRSNITPAAEFNIYVDPEAAKRTFDAGIEPTLVPLDVTFESQITPSEIETIRDEGEVGRIIAEFLDYASEYYTNTHDLAGYPVHDAVALANSITPIVETEYVHVDIETDSEFCDGRTVCDFDNRTDREPNASVGVSLDREAFIELLYDAVEAFD